jgi:hypothetical protein
MRYVSTVIAVILFIIATIIGVNLVRKEINNTSKVNIVDTSIPLSEYKKTGAKLRFKITGPVVADENHQELVFEISQGTRAVKLYKGYNSTLVKEQTISNNYNAYNALTEALYASGFTTVKSTQKDAKYQGECPNGKLFTAELLSNDSRVIKSLWKTSCSSKTGSLNGSYSAIQNLFIAQFPDYKTFSSGVSID